jgi:hypothetical protein
LQGAKPAKIAYFSTALNEPINAPIYKKRQLFARSAVFALCNFYRFLSTACSITGHADGVIFALD